MRPLLLRAAVLALLAVPLAWGVRRALLLDVAAREAHDRSLDFPCPPVRARS